MQSTSPPKGSGPLQKREAKLAWGMLAPTLISASLVVILPLLAIFWISFKPISLADLRVPTPNVYERIKGDVISPGDEAVLEYRLKNSSREDPISNVIMRDILPKGMTVLDLDPRCTLEGRNLRCEFGDWEPGFKEKLRIPFTGDQDFIDTAPNPRDSPAVLTGKASSPLFNNTFTLDNFIRLFDGREFWNVIGVTVFYAVFGTLGALVVGLFAAMLLNKSFKGQGMLRGFFLFPYVAPVIAVAFTWVT
ncbi:MAG TPA: sugar ABC transporter permease, partial [Aliiroseovarius sp.]|nr:sugar ABC transporter permease [Aliiroseovarius sp.]